MAEKLSTALLVISGVILLLNIGGIITPNSTPTSIVLNILLNPQNIQNLNLFQTALAAITFVGGAVAGIVIGLTTKNFEIAAMTAFTPIFASYIFDIIEIYKVLAVVNEVVALLIMAPVTFLLIMVLVDWWRGRD